MFRKNFIDILGSYGFNHIDEYKRLQVLVYRAPIRREGVFKDQEIFLYDVFSNYFCSLPRWITGTCITLKDFDNTHGFSFTGYIEDKSFEEYLTFCEYVYNIAHYLCHSGGSHLYSSDKEMCEYVLEQIRQAVEKCAHQIILDKNNSIYIITPKDAAVNLVTELVEEKIAFRMIEYNHHSLKTDVESKRAILIVLANDLERKRQVLKRVDEKLADNLFFLFNSIGIRHNNEQNAEVVNGMKIEKLISWYDDTFQLCMQAYLALDNQEIIDKANKLRLSIKSRK